MRPLGWTRLGIVLAAILPGLPVQALAVRKAPRLAGRIAVAYHRFFLRLLGIRLHVVGRPAADRPLLLVANHVSWLDVPVLGSLMPLAFVARADMATWPGVGLLARLQRCVFVDRSSRAATAATAATMAERLAAGDTLVLFPEGTTSDGNRVLPFRSSLLGAVERTAGTVIQPLTIVYSARDGLPLTRADRPGLAWYGDMDLGPHALPILSRGAIDVWIMFGAPLQDERPNRKRLTRRLEAAVREGFVAARRGQGGKAGEPPPGYSQNPPKGVRTKPIPAKNDPEGLPVP